jgi:hypothetical protein
MAKSGVRWVWGLAFGACFVLALFPPIYLAAARNDPHVLGLPFGVAYMIFVGLLITASIMGAYLWERATGRIES